MLCSTCRFYNQDGYCRQGRAVELYSLLALMSRTTPGTPFSCSGYVKGETAIPTPPLPSYLNGLVTEGRTILNGIPFPVRGFIDHTDYNYDGLFKTTHTISVLEGDPGYFMLRHELSRERVFVEGSIEGSKVCHYWKAGAPNFSMSISGEYSRYRGGPIIVTLTLLGTKPMPHLSSIDISPYIWWLDVNAPSHAVEHYLYGLIELYKDRDKLPHIIDPMKLTVGNTCGLPPTSPYTTTTYKGREMYEYLRAEYIDHAKDYGSLTVNEVEYQSLRWKDILKGYYYNTWQ